MKNFKFSYALMAFGLLWVFGSFYFLSSTLAKRYQNKLGLSFLESAQKEIYRTSDHLKFKIGQWAYNYHLVKTQGVEFDVERFMESEFKTMYFFKKEDTEFVPQWVKSKDLDSGEISKSFRYNLKTTIESKSIKNKKYFYFLSQTNSKTIDLNFGFFIQDSFMGDGLIVAALDNDYFKMLTQNLPIYLVDEKGRFLFHPKSEYLGKSASTWLRAKSKSIVKIQKTDPYLDFNFVYLDKNNWSGLSFLNAVWIMSIGLLITFGVLLFEVFIQTPTSMGSLANENPNSLESLRFDEKNKVDEMFSDKIKEGLNKISLLSSTLKGRFDLMSLESVDKEFFVDLKKDFDSLDKNIDIVYKQLSNYVPVQNKSEELEQSENDYNLTEFKSSDLKLNSALSEDDLKVDNLVEHLDFEIPSYDDHVSDLLSEEKSLKAEERVVFQEYIGLEAESNDWAKIIEELTEEINTVEIKPTKTELSQQTRG